MTILLLEETDAAAAHIQSTLEAGDVGEVLRLRSGWEALQYLGIGVVDPAPTRVDLILTEILLPDLDGIEITRKIKADPRFADIPVFIVTGVTNSDDLRDAFAAGASDYLVKPPSETELLARVEAGLRAKRALDQRTRRENELREVTRQLEWAIRELRRLSGSDAVSGIANRRRFEEVYDREWRRARRDRAPIAVLLLEIDATRRADSARRTLGANLVRRVAGAVQSCLYRPADFAARLAVSSFVVLLPQTDLEGALAVAERIRARIEQGDASISDEDAFRGIHVNTGVAAIRPTADTEPKVLLTAADRALRAAKAQRRASASGDEPAIAAFHA